MPELPEIETTCRGITPGILKRKIRAVVIRDHRLRWPVPDHLHDTLKGRVVQGVYRRGKYLLIRFTHGHLILHLGMSGSLRTVHATLPPEIHDHVDIELDSGYCLRLRDPRRFGSLHWTGEPPDQHWLLASMGPEPLLPEFSGDYLHGKSRNRLQAVKTFIMDSRVIAGIGNIYANEALFLGGIRPFTHAGKISLGRYRGLAAAIREVLNKAIDEGGTTIRDFVSSDGSPGYFQQVLNVYGRENEPCRRCHGSIRARLLNQRSTYYCPACQR